MNLGEAYLMMGITQTLFSDRTVKYPCINPILRPNKPCRALLNALLAAPHHCRMLVQLCKTLDEVPKERYIFCRLIYHDNAPEDYEPQFFRSMDASELGHFPRKPFTM